MRSNTLRAIAVTLGLGVCTIAQAQSLYTSPARWNNFRPISDRVQAAAVNNAASNIPAPIADLPAPAAEPIPNSAADSAGSGSYQQAMSAPWDGSENVPCGSACGGSKRPAMAPWFGSANLLFYTLENGSGSRFACSAGRHFSTSIVDPDASTGFDVSAGKYLGCGRYGLGMTYMLWNPGTVSEIRTGAVGSFVGTPAYNNVSIDAGSGVESVYSIIDGSGAYAGAAAVRATRDLMFQGIEVNLFSFGLMGAQRIAYKSCNSGSCLGNRCKGYGGAAGPLQQCNLGRVRVMTSHGFRWLQVRDDLEFAYNIDGSAGYQASDLYESVDIENNLYGYQFGSRLTYCLGCRLNLNIGGKFGIYGNNARMRHRIGTVTTAAYRNGVGTDLIDTDSSDTSLATLGELDLGLGYRVGCAWTIRGGYRLLGVTGVARSVDSVPTDYSSLATSGQVHADDSYILHGGYFGLEYNW